MGRSALLALLVLALAVPAAQAQGSNAPPGNSGVDQYLEAVPSASGNTPSNGAAAAKPGPVSRAVTRALSNRGAAGAQLKRLVATTQPARGTSPAKHARAHRASTAASAPSASPVRSAVVAATGSGDGNGPWLPLILGGVALAAVALLVTRALRARRSGA